MSEGVENSGLTDEIAVSLTSEEPPEEDAGFVDEPNGELAPEESE